MIRNENVLSLPGSRARDALAAETFYKAVIDEISVCIPSKYDILFTITVTIMFVREEKDLFLFTQMFPTA